MGPLASFLNITVALALLTVLVIRPALARWATRRAARTLADFESPRIHVLERSDLPRWIDRKLTPLRAQFVGLGFRELLSFSRESQRMNYSSVLVSADGLLCVHVWVARSSGLMRWLMLLHSWRAFARNMLALPRFAVITHFDGFRHYASSPVELGTVNEPGEMEFFTLPPGTSPAEALQLHEPGARTFMSRWDAKPVSLTSEQTFLEIERAHCAQIAAHRRRRRQRVSST